MMFYDNRKMLEQYHKQARSILQVNIDQTKLNKFFASIMGQVNLHAVKIQAIEMQIVQATKQSVMGIQQVRELQRIVRQYHEKSSWENETMRIEKISQKAEQAAIEYNIKQQWEKQFREQINNDIKHNRAEVESKLFQLQDSHRLTIAKLQSELQQKQSEIISLKIVLKEQQSEVKELSSLRAHNKPKISSHHHDDEQKSKQSKTRQTVPNNNANSNKINNEKTIEYATVSQKMDQLEKRMNQLENRPLNIVAYPNKLSKRDSQFSYISEESQQLKESDRSRMMDNPSTKTCLQQFELRICEIENEIQDLKSICTKLQQTTQKAFHDKANLTHSTTSSMPNNLQSSSNGQPHKDNISDINKSQVSNDNIYVIQNYLKNIQSQLDLQEMKYVRSDKFTKEMECITRKVNVIDSLIKSKGDKQQIKNAFGFIEGKIRQLVIVMADSFGKQRQTAINKIVQKRCLTCNGEQTLPANRCIGGQKTNIKQRTKSPGKGILRRTIKLKMMVQNNQ